MKNCCNIYKDKYYIPILLEKINNELLEKRLSHELFTYAKRAIFYKRTFYILTFSTIIFPAIITVINVFSEGEFSIVRLIVTILSALTSVCGGILGIANVRENWIIYRKNCELLKEEILKFEMSIEPYNISDTQVREELFAKNIFKYYHEETSSWEQILSSTK